MNKKLLLLLAVTSVLCAKKHARPLTPKQIVASMSKQTIENMNLVYNVSGIIKAKDGFTFPQTVTSGCLSETGCNDKNKISDQKNRKGELNSINRMSYGLMNNQPDTVIGTMITYRNKYSYINYYFHKWFERKKVWVKSKRGKRVKQYRYRITTIGNAQMIHKLIYDKTFNVILATLYYKKNYDRFLKKRGRVGAYKRTVSLYCGTIDNKIYKRKNKQNKKVVRYMIKKGLIRINKGVASLPIFRKGEA